MDQHGQTAQKLKPVKNVQNCSKMISANKNFSQSFPETLQDILILQESKQYGQTTQKLKIGLKRQKLLKPIENNLERVFVTKKQNSLFFETFFFQFVQNA